MPEQRHPPSRSRRDGSRQHSDPPPSSTTSWRPPSTSCGRRSATSRASSRRLRQPDVEWDEATRADFLAEVEREADRLASLIGDLLDLSRLERGGLDRAAVRPAVLVAGGLDRVRGLLADHPVARRRPRGPAPGRRRRPPARARPGQPARERGQVLPARHPDHRLGRGRCPGPGSSWSSRTAGPASRPTCSTGSSTSSSAPRPRPTARSPGPAWACGSPARSCRPTAGGSGPRTGPTAAPDSSSRSR